MTARNGQLPANLRVKKTKGGLHAHFFLAFIMATSVSEVSEVLTYISNTHPI